MKTAFAKSFLLFLITMTLVACGGGGGGDDSSEYESVFISKPRAPQGITIENDEDGNIVLDWSVAERSDNEVMSRDFDTISYNIYWSTSGHSDLEDRMASVNVSEPPFIHKNLSLGTTYYYEITAVQYGLESGSPGIFSATAGVPTKPVNLSAESVSTDIRLSWEPAARADFYNVSWSNSLGESGMIDFATSPLLHTGLVGVGYEYVVTASNAYGNSTEVAVTAIPALPPETPVGLGIRVGTDFDICLPDLEDCSDFIREDATFVQVDWQDIGADFQAIGGEYDVYRVYPSGQESRVTRTSNSYYSNRFRDTSSPPDSYCYYVVARNNFGTSLPTRTVCGFNPWNVPW